MTPPVPILDRLRVERYEQTHQPQNSRPVLTSNGIEFESLHASTPAYMC
jgi:hypothetical protein